MKRSMIKPIAICLCMILLVSSSVAAFALTNEKKEEAEQPQTMSTGNTAEEQSNSKDETVYVIAGADGSVQKIIVSDWIKNTLGSNTIRDKSELTDVENVKSDESYTLGSDNTRVWDAQGNDIYYQGNIEKELPVGLSVTYKLDGKTVSPAELAGKSGKVTIRFDYTNQQYEYVEIDGQKKKIYVPFAMLTGILLDNDVFTNVEITNGKLINDGSRTAVIGIAFPGLQDNLAISPEKLEIPDYVEITANAKNFKLGMTITLATNELFNEMDADHLDSISDLSGSLGEMTDAMEQLMDGSSQLYDGLSTLQHRHLLLRQFGPENVWIFKSQKERQRHQHNAHSADEPGMVQPLQDADSNLNEQRQADGKLLFPGNLFPVYRQTSGAQQQIKGNGPIGDQHVYSGGIVPLRRHRVGNRQQKIPQFRHRQKSLGNPIQVAGSPGLLLHQNSNILIKQINHQHHAAQKQPVHSIIQ